MLHMERALYPFALGNVYGMELHLCVLGEAFIAVMGIAAQNRASLFYTSANGICDIGLADTSERSYAKIQSGLSVLGDDDRDLVIAVPLLPDLPPLFLGLWSL